MASPFPGEAERLSKLFGLPPEKLFVDVMASDDAKRILDTMAEDCAISSLPELVEVALKPTKLPPNFAFDYDGPLYGKPYDFDMDHLPDAPGFRKAQR